MSFDASRLARLLSSMKTGSHADILLLRSRHEISTLVALCRVESRLC